MKQMEEVGLRPHIPVDPVDPLTIIAPYQELADMYLGARQTPQNPEGSPDGVVLFNRKLMLPAAEIAAHYQEHRRTQGGQFNHNTFVDEYLEPTVNGATAETPEAPPGMSMVDYIDYVDPYLIRHMPDDYGPFLGLPHPFRTPGDRYVGSFPQDDYFASLADAARGDWEMVLNAADNGAYQLDRYGRRMNANLACYAGRGQKEYFSYQVELVAQQYGKEALVHYLPQMLKAYGGWMAGAGMLKPDRPDVHRRVVRTPGSVERPEGYVLNRYYDDAPGMRLESILEDTELGDRVTFMMHGKEKERRLAQLALDVKAACESCYDFSGRWFRDGRNMETIETTNIIPIDLNANLVHMERTIAAAYEAQGDFINAEKFYAKALLRAEAINTLMFNPIDGSYRDIRLDGQQTDYPSMAMGSVLFAGGIANHERSVGLARTMQRFKRKGGYIISLAATEQQWDGPFVWGPPNHEAIDGAMAAAISAKAHGYDGAELLDIAQEGTETLVGGFDESFQQHRKMPEKIHGDNPAGEAEAGEYRRPNGFGISNGPVRNQASRNFKEEYVTDVRDLPPRYQLHARAAGALAFSY